MTPAELLTLFRTEVFDLEAPYLWSDTLVLGYLDEAQKQFCRDTYGIADARSFKINVVPGTSWYSTDPRILKLRDVVDAATGRGIPVVPVEKMADHDMRFDGKTGPIKALVSGLEENTLRAWPTPSLATTFEMRTFRLPEDLVSGGDLEIAPQHHRYLLHWVKHLAYNVQDAETYDKNAADRYEDKHREYCARAKDEMSRAMHTAGTVIYGGI